MGKTGVITAVIAGLMLPVMLVLTVVVLGSNRLDAMGLPGVVCAPPGGEPGDPVGGFAGRQLANAAAIVAAGVEAGMSPRAQVIAVATAMQESGLLMYANSDVPESLALSHDRVGSDHDSVGLFQQRAGWGPVAIRMDPKGSAALFYNRLRDVAGWESMSLTEAAQTVQVSAFPDAYARWEPAANQVVGAAAGIVCTTPAGGVVDLPANPLARTVVTRAMSQVGVPYVWAGGNANGPTLGGFDCSGLMVYAFAGIGVTVPHQSGAIWATWQPAITDIGKLQAGDMLLFSTDGQASGIHHVALYLGEGHIVHAPQTGSTVQVVDNIWNSPYWSRQFIGAVRPLPAAAPSASQA